MNIVGTPCSAVQRCLANDSSVSAASKPSPGNTIVAPDVTQHSTPSTMPKQWYSGTGMHSLSSGASAIALAQKRALLTMLKCDSVAPFGAPVVPLVNWMLIASSGSSAARQRVEPAALRRPAEREQPAHTTEQRGGTGSSSSSTTCFSDGSRTLSSTSLAPLKWISGAMSPSMPR